MELEPELPWSDRPVFRSIDCGSGWYKLISDLNTDLLAINPDYTVTQVKEKFGTLRYYVNYETNSSDVQSRMNLRIGEAEALSAVTCEWCGGTGSGRSGGWYRTLCDNCEAQYQERRKSG